MKDFNKSWQYCKYRCLKWKEDRKLQVMLVLLCILIFEYTGGIREMTRITGIPTTPFFLPFFLSDYVIAMGLIKIYILLTWIIMICDVHNMNQEKYYYIIRTGRRNWLRGDIYYMGITSVLYTFLIFLCSILFFIPRIEFKNSWGKIIGTLAYSDAGQKFAELFVIPSKILESYEPIPAMLVTLLLMLLGFFFLSMLIYTLNTITKTKIAGICCAGALVLLCPLISNIGYPMPFWFSPMSWMSIGSLASVRGEGFPTLLYGTFMYLILTGVLLFVLCIANKKVQIGE